MPNSKRQRLQWTIEVVPADAPPGDVESFLRLYAQLVIEQDRKSESPETLKRVA